MAADQAPSEGANNLYSHDETVAAITSYYKLVSRAHAVSTDSTLLHPPPEGWPQLSADSGLVSGLGFSDEALNLIRHIPYFENSDLLQILPDVQPCSYIENQRLLAVANQRNSEQGGDGGETSPPPHLVLLGQIPQQREFGHDVWLDTKLGNAIMGNYHAQARPSIGDIPEDGIYPDANDHSYDNLFSKYGQKGEGCTWRISTFFAACERNLRELEWIPGMDEGDNGWLLDEGESPYAMLDYEHRKRIMRENGWPDGDWNPDGVVEELDRLLSTDGNA
ncbi:hypothetical protein F5Y05DRAFT_287078 [Hypoxylon sp. FL0543]|nr:hypothetical protein F5Y05DRAFT_287078 [Hypoxylon sp. FL0543]